MTWRARSASDKTENWLFWYVTKDAPKDYNDLPEAYLLAFGEKWPPVLPFLSRPECERIVARLNTKDI